jgi:ABC-type Zn uptake system ZnuABC Zn-binding protein ZnuA
MVAVCAGRAPTRPTAAASIFPIYDVARRVAGDRIQMELILSPGRLDHSFDPRPRDVIRLEAALVVFVAGLGLDGWAATLARSASDGRARLVELGPRLDPVPSPDGAPDPHFFLDPVRMARGAAIIAESLTAVDPEGRAGFEERAQDVAKSLLALDADLRNRAVSWRKRTIVTFHGSWFYFGARYGLRVAGVVERRPGQEPSPKEMTELLATIREGGVAAVFTEPQLDARPARSIAEAGVPLFDLDPIGGGPGARSYEAWLLKNADVLTQALQ